MTIAVVGGGLVGTRVAHTLGVLEREHVFVPAERRPDPATASVVVLATGGPHAERAAEHLDDGQSVVSVSDDLADIIDLLALGDRAADAGATLVVGAACSPGMTALIVRNAEASFDVVEEVHTAVHGTGGPMCARQHHRNLSGTAIGWHDGDWIKRPAGSGRELCWFPNPVNAHDCYRFASGEPLLLQRAMPSLRRISSRVSATRRDRLTAQLPMLSPPHREGGIGGLRVEVRGMLAGSPHVEVYGMAERVASLAASVAGNVAATVVDGRIAPGAHALGEQGVPNSELLAAVLRGGYVLQQFVGT